MKMSPLRLQYFAALAVSFSAFAQGSATASVVIVSEHTCTAVNRAIHDPTLKPDGIVRLEAGVYDCVEPIVVDRDGVTLLGAGSAMTLVQARKGYPMPVVTIGIVENNTVKRKTIHWGEQVYPAREVHNIRVEGLSIDGNMTKKTEEMECYDASVADFTKRGRTCDNDNGRFVRNNGLTIRRAIDIVVKDIVSLHSHSGGMTVEKECRRLLVDGFYTAANRFDGFAGYETEDSLFKNMILEKQPYSGISIDLGFENNTFENVIARDNKDRGIYSVQDSKNKFINVSALNNGNQGFYIVGREVDMPVGHVKDDASFEPGSCQSVELKNVLIEGNAHEGIYLGQNCQDLRVESTTIRTPNANVGCIVENENSSVTGEVKCSLGK